MFDERAARMRNGPSGTRLVSIVWGFSLLLTLSACLQTDEPAGLAQDIQVFGPATFYAASGNAEQRSSFAANPSLKYVLYARNFGADGGEIKLNGTKIQELKPFKKGEPEARVEVDLGASNTIDVKVKGKSGSITVRIASLIRAEDLPKDPASVAPELPENALFDFSSGTEFLYTGSNPIQRGVVLGAIDPVRVAVLRGRVLDTSGNPLPGVTVSALNHPEFGFTMTRADGQYDLAVNGGGAATLQFRNSGLMTVQRYATLPSRDFAVLPDVVMMGLDEKVTWVSFGSSTPDQIVEASPVSDEDGARKAVLFVPPNVGASLVASDGTLRPAGSLSIRATEITVGPSGPNAMPGILPATSAYTYAVKLSADEAIAANAAGVRFTQPLYHYVDNFLGLPVGATVPVGYYDESQGTWIPSKNGRIIKVLAVDGGTATLDASGSGTPASSAELQALGVSAAELRRIGTLYAAGSSFWRSPIEHFTVYDANFSPLVPPSPAILAGAGSLDRRKGRSCPRPPRRGSMIDVYEQRLRQAVPVTGSGMQLTYSSETSSDRKASYTLRIPLTGDDVSSFNRVRLELNIAGVSYSETFAAAPNRVFEYTWNGRDAYGRKILGSVEAFVSIAYELQTAYGVPVPYEYSFGQPASEPFSPSTSLRVDYLGHVAYSVPVGVWDSRAVGLGSWRLDAHHAYDFRSRTLHFGDGTSLSADLAGDELKHIAGNGDASITGDGGQAVNAGLGDPSSAIMLPGGSILISDGARIRRVDREGIISTIHSPPGTIVALAYSKKLDSVIYHRSFGTESFLIRLFPGGDTQVLNATFQGREPPTQLSTLRLGQLKAFAVSDDGSIFYVSNAPGVVRIGPDGFASYIPGTSSIVSVDSAASGMAASASGEHIYVVQQGELLEVSVSGRIRRVDDASIGSPVVAVTTGRSGEVYYLNRTGRIHKIEGSRKRELAISDSVNLVSRPASLHMGPDGSLILAESSTRRVLAVKPTYPGIEGTGLLIASPDGSQLFRFTQDGLHLRTFDAYTQATLFIFNYDSSGRLVSIVDRAQNLTTIARNTQGDATAIVSPYGVTTSLAIQDGLLRAITNPAGEAHAFEYSPGTSLMSAMTGPRGFRSEYAYDALGRLAAAKAPGHQAQTIEKIDEDVAGATVHYTSAEGLRSTYTERATDGVNTVTDIDPDGTRSSTTFSPNGSASGLAADQTSFIQRSSPDPRFGGQASYSSSVSTRLPNGGPTRVVATSRSVTYGEVNPSGDRDFILNETTTINGNSWLESFDSAQRTFLNTSAVGRQSAVTLDPAGRVSRVDRAGVLPLSFDYDPRGRLSSIAQGSRVRTFGYDAAGNLSQVTNEAQQTYQFGYDPAGRNNLLVFPDGRSIGLTYDPDGNVSSLAPPGRPAHTMGYNLFSLMESYTPPQEAASTRYFYDQDRKLTRVLRPDGREAVFSYHGTTGKLSSVSTGEGIVNYTYSPTTGQLSRLEALDRNSNLIQRSLLSWQGFRERGSTNQGVAASSVSWTSDSDFNPQTQVVSVFIPGSSGALLFQYLFDRDSLPLGGFNLELTRDPVTGFVRSGIFAGNNYLDGVLQPTLTLRSHFEHNTFGEVSATRTQRNYGDRSDIYRASYTRDSLGRIARKTEMALGVTHEFDYEYDASGRLSLVKRDGVQTAKYSYDSNSNRILKETPSGSTSSAYDVQDRLILHDKYVFTYTANGEVETRTEIATQAVTRYGYDTFGNLTSVVLPDGRLIQYVLDGRMRRIAKKIDGAITEQYVYQDALRIAAKLDGQGVLRQAYTYPHKSNVPEVIASFERYNADGTFRQIKYWVVADERGSPRLILDAYRDQISEIEYDEFGVKTRDTSPGLQPFGFAGCLYDEDTKLCHFGAREYDAETGRWLSKDPILFAGGDANLFGYGLQDPVNFVDLNGKSPTAIAKAACLALAGAEGITSMVDIKVSLDLLSQIDDAIKDAAKLQSKCGSSSKDREIIDRSNRTIEELTIMRDTIATQLAGAQQTGALSVVVAFVCGAI